jgi:hypothetical protein
MAIAAAGFAPPARADESAAPAQVEAASTGYGWFEYEMICDVIGCHFFYVCESYDGFVCSERRVEDGAKEIVSLTRRTELEQSCAVSYQRVWNKSSTGVLFYVYTCPAPKRES